VIDDFAKGYLHDELRFTRQALVWKLEGLSDYDVRRPLTATGTNLLGLVKHLATWEHADATIDELPIDAPGHVPWWPRPDVKLFNVMMHVLGDTTRHAGHADVLREQLDGRTGVTAAQEEQIDTAARAAHVARVERAAVAADQLLGGEGVTRAARNFGASSQ
jgi:hypothetical protein